MVNKEYYQNIKQQMDTMFFRKKSVMIDNDLFGKYYNLIFPEEDLFYKFVNATGRDMQLKYARKIVDRLLFQTPWDGMQVLFGNLISYEKNDLSEKDGEFIAQDHAVHSVQLYMLGLYLYFNSDVFHETLMQYFKNIDVQVEWCYTLKEKSTINFVKAWQWFALLHDLGYPYEALFDAEGKKKKQGIDRFFHEYENLEQYAIYYGAIDIYAQIVMLGIIKRNKVDFLMTDFKLNINDYVSLDDGKTLKESIADKKLQTKYVQIPYINNNCDIVWISKWLNWKNGLIIIRDKNYEDFAIILYQDGVQTIYEKERICEINGFGKDEFTKVNMYEQERRGWLFELYLEGEFDRLYDGAMRKWGLMASELDIDMICEDMINKVSVKLVWRLGRRRLEDAIYIISRELMKYFSLKEGIELDKLGIINIQQLSKKDEQILNRTMLESWQKQWRDIRKKVTIEENGAEALTKLIEKIDLRELRTDVSEMYHKKKRDKDRLEFCYSDLYNRILLKIYQKDKKKIEFDYNSISYSQIIQIDTTSLVMEKMKRLAEKEKFIVPTETIEKFEEYQTSYAKIDHGIVIALIAGNYCQNVKENYEEYAQVLPLPNMKYNKCDEVIAETLYAILVHNIYIDIYAGNRSDKPIHNLMINPFSYFGMFCDNLQIWDRDKNVNQGIVPWTGLTLYGEDIGIYFENERIRIICKANDIKSSFAKLKETLGKYLVSADEMLLLELWEE